jgi:hypothetical protein
MKHAAKVVLSLALCSFFPLHSAGIPAWVQGHTEDACRCFGETGATPAPCGPCGGQYTLKLIDLSFSTGLCGAPPECPNYGYCSATVKAKVICAGQPAYYLTNASNGSVLFDLVASCGHSSHITASCPGGGAIDITIECFECEAP